METRLFVYIAGQASPVMCPDDILAVPDDLNLRAGYNGFGQLGTGDGKDSWRFTPVTGLNSVAKACIVSGENHACVVTKRGEMYFWGRGDCGQLGAGNDFSREVPQKLAGYRVAHPDHTLRSPYSRAASAQ